MSIHFCRVCGVKLCRENAYKNRKKGHGYRRICKKCHNLESIDRIKKNRTKSCKYRLKAINRSKVLEFPDYYAKHSYLVLRNLQSISSRPSIGYTSRVGQRVEHMVEDRDQETHKLLRRYYLATKCDECGGEVAFNPDGFKECRKCHLLVANFTLDNELGTESGPRDLRPSEYYSHARQDKSSMEGSA